MVMCCPKCKGMLHPVDSSGDVWECENCSYRGPYPQLTQEQKEELVSLVSSKSIFTILPIPVDERVPEGYSLIVAYAKDDEIVVPIDLSSLPEEHHNCDWEGCSSVHHVVRFSIKHKYDIESQLDSKK